MKYTNLNITNSSKSFKYIVEYSGQDLSFNGLKYMKDGNNVYMNVSDCPSNHIKLMRNENEWSCLDQSGSQWKSNYISNPGFAKVKLYFPEFSVDVYEDGVYYAIDFQIKIRNISINLGSFSISRNEALACPVKNFLGNRYYEYAEVTIPDPYEIIYGSNWTNFRKNVCGKKIESGVELNNDIPNLMITLNPVKLNESSVYSKTSEYDGCQGFICVSDHNDYLSLKISHTFNDSGDIFQVKCTPVFNNAYNNLFEYFKETYYIDVPRFELELVIQDNDNIYRQRLHTITRNSVDSNWNFDIFEEATEIENKFYFENWSSGWTQTLSFSASLTVYDSTGDNEVLYIKSNSIPITEEVFKYLIKDSINKKYIDISSMTINNVNVVNKVIKKVVNQDTTPKESKSHFLSPVFFKAQSLQNIVMHPDVTENICINLDAYKSKVNSFSLQVEGVVFIEQGRSSSGVIFKVIGSKLPKETPSGTYYILNESKEMVTSGKYTYEY